MNIEIIKPGKKPITSKYFVCSNCGCEFRADNKSYYATSQTATIFEGINYVCECPTCGKMVYIE